MDVTEGTMPPTLTAKDVSYVPAELLSTTTVLPEAATSAAGRVTVSVVELLGVTVSAVGFVKTIDVVLFSTPTTLSPVAKPEPETTMVAAALATTAAGEIEEASKPPETVTPFANDALVTAPACVETVTLCSPEYTPLLACTKQVNSVSEMTVGAAEQASDVSFTPRVFANATVSLDPAGPNPEPMMVTVPELDSVNVGEITLVIVGAAKLAAPMPKPPAPVAEAVLTAELPSGFVIVKLKAPVVAPFATVSESTAAVEELTVRPFTVTPLSLNVA